MQTALIVGLGGFVGTILRYGLGKIPVAGDFPLITVLINIIGSFAIGIVSEFAKDEAFLHPNTVIFLQTGLCGGFTTFSAFSLDTVALLQKNRYLTGSSYAILTVILCLGGAVLGMLLARAIKSNIEP